MYLKLLTSDNAHIYASMIPDAFLKKDEFLGVVCLNEADAPLGVAVVEPRDEDLCSVRALSLQITVRGKRCLQISISQIPKQKALSKKSFVNCAS